MSDVKRYRFSRCKLHFDPHVCLCGKVEHPDGDYVLYAEHACIVAEKDAEIQRLREGGAGLIATERQRQLSEEGWTPEHDDGHTLAELAIAGLSYASVAASQVRLRDGCVKERLPTYWPWSADWWKPSDDPVRNLIKAGALIAAEIDRLQRAALNQPQQASSACVHRRHAECHFAACVCECHNPPQQKGTSDEK